MLKKKVPSNKVPYNSLTVSVSSSCWASELFRLEGAEGGLGGRRRGRD